MNTLTRPHAREREATPGGAAPLLLDRYRLLEQIGVGGHGSVWRARDERLRRDVAVKRITRGEGRSPNESVGRRRAEREALAAARLAHPAIVALYEAGSDEEAFYLVSELVEGTSLGELFGERSLSDRELVRIGVALANALIHAHARGVVHRDIKPPNVIIPAEPAETGAPAKLTDFGVASILDEQAFTNPGEVLGTYAYMAPEQAEGRPAAAEADLFSLALTLYEGFSGTNPHRGETVAATVRRLSHKVPSLARVRRDMPAALCAAIDKAVSLDPAQRGTVEELRIALASSLHGASDEPRVHARRAPGAFARSVLPRLLAGAAAGGVAAVSLLTILAPQRQVSVLTIAAGAALAVMLSARVGWLAMMLGAACLLAARAQDGAALLVLAALAPVPALLPRGPRVWSVPAIAPMLGLAGLAGAFPALAAALAPRSPWRRAALGALGYWWLALAELLGGRRLLLGPARGTRPRASWAHSLTGTVDHALVPLATSPRLIAAALWALAALVLPWLGRPRSRLVRGALALAWTAALMVGASELASRLAIGELPLPPLAALAALAIAFAAFELRRRSPGATDVA